MQLSAQKCCCCYKMSITSMDSLSLEREKKHLWKDSLVISAATLACVVGELLGYKFPFLASSTRKA